MALFPVLRSFCLSDPSYYVLQRAALGCQEEKVHSGSIQRIKEQGNGINIDPGKTLFLYFYVAYSFCYRMLVQIVAAKVAARY